MRVNLVNNNQNLQNFGFKMKSIYLQSPDGTKILPVTDKEAQKLLFKFGNIDLFVKDALIGARILLYGAIKTLKMDIKSRKLGCFSFIKIHQKLKIETEGFHYNDFAIEKNGEKYTLTAYRKDMLNAKKRHELKIEDWANDSKEKSSEFLTTTKIVEIEPENEEELAELKQMHAQMAENIAPFKEHYKAVTGRELPEDYMIDGRAL